MYLVYTQVKPQVYNRNHQLR